MNIEVLQDHIDSFKRDIIDSGFRRDLDDYISSLPSSQSNIVALRDIANDVISSLELFYTSDLPENLVRLLPSEEEPPFTETPYNENLKTLIKDTEIQQNEFFSQLHSLLSELQTEIQQDTTQIEEIEQFIEPYLTRDEEELIDSDLAIISIIFKEHQTITSLKKFTRTLSVWNRILPVYHQLLKSDSPKDIQIVEVQNGSIDFVVNIDVDVALDLAELFKLGFEVFAAYLSYKQMIKPIIDSYHGNKKLITQEGEREKLLLENIGDAIKKQISTQHRSAKKTDKTIDGTAIPKKVEQVEKLITSHIVNGNDFKLLATPLEHTADDGGSSDIRESLRKLSVSTRRKLQSIPKKAQDKLLQAYGTLDENENGE